MIVLENRVAFSVLVCELCIQCFCQTMDAYQLCVNKFPTVPFYADSGTNAVNFLALGLGKDDVAIVSMVS